MGMADIKALVAKHKEQSSSTKLQYKKRAILNIPSAHSTYLPAFLRIMRQAGLDLEIMVVRGNLTSAGLSAKATLAEVDYVIIANQVTLTNLVQHELGRSRKVDADVWAGSVLRLDDGTPALVVYQLNQVYARRWTGLALEFYLKKLKAVNSYSANPFEWFEVQANDEALVYSIIVNAELMAIDIETNRKRIITCVGFSVLTRSGSVSNYVIDLRSDGLAAKLGLVKLLCASEATKIFHNGTYDNQFFQMYGIVVNNWTLDTEYLMYSMYEEMPRTLAFVSGLFNPEARYWKHEHDADLLEYNAKDCEHTLRACIAMLEILPDYAKPKYAAVFALTTPAIYYAVHGIKAIPNKLSALELDALEVVEPLQAELDTICGLGLGYTLPLGLEEVEHFNVNSPKQLNWLLYGILGGKFKGRGKLSSDKVNRRKLAQQSPILAKVVDLIDTIITSRKAINTYFTAELYDDRLLYSYRIDGTDTGRLSCKKSNFGDVGAQVQNIPAYMKHALIPDEGYSISEIDKSQAEARITAYFADDEALIKALEDPTKDFYRTCGSLFFGIAYEDVTTELRNKVIKKIIHGTNYMMQAGTFIDTVGATTLLKAQADLGYKHMTLMQFADYLLGLYHKAYPRVAKWYDETSLALRTQGYLVSPLNWRRNFFGDPTSSGTLRSAVAHQPQNLNVAIVNTATHRMFWQLVVPSNGEFCMIAQVHDSLLSQMKIGTEHKYMPLAKRILEDIPVTFKSGKTMVIPVDGAYGNSWADVK